ncbi:AlwI family type II restriction endonuclease [Campylobacter iguaniorum]|uniref:AlwI family type II restriction endonuclease n=1 Tax=Campylobacter iguaniorum TaxID=1244531 RepID=UPI0009EDBA26|nr:AlwI family type II restriction endonuclease [Campylobacter iguaniorum]
MLDDQRKLTAAGRKILHISQMGDFSVDNALQISSDSFAYLKQLLKVSNSFKQGQQDIYVRPLIVVLFMLNRYRFLTENEFTYLLPLCIDMCSTEYISTKIQLLREEKVNLDDIISHILLSRANYIEMLEWFLSCDNVDESAICNIGINRKSSQYDKPYFKVYASLKKVFLNKNTSEKALLELFKSINALRLSSYWKKAIFIKGITKARIKKELGKCLIQSRFYDIVTENDFKRVFFETMHLFKAKATLKDYFDLNRRFLGLGDILLFRDKKVELDIVPKYFFNNIIGKLYKEAFTNSPVLQNDCKLEDISPFLILDERIVVRSINDEFQLNISTADEAKEILEKERYARFNKLIDEKFSDAALITLLEHFETRQDEYIREYITDNAEIPTIFEYVLGIAWYKISERKGRILDYIKLSLDANLLPKSHAIGGEADIVYEYDETIYYPKHTLLLEATLADKINQRRIELEPVSRHLGQHLLKSKNLNSYCVFATTHLDINVLSDFRNRKIIPYYETNNTKNKVKGMKITALQSTELKSIIRNNRKYRELYDIFEEAYEVDLTLLDADEWYQKYIVEKI